MRFTVVWQDAALNELATIWTTAIERHVVTAAADEIERSLRSNPAAKGEEFYGDRLLIVDPLQVTFAVSAEDMLVRILHIAST